MAIPNTAITRGEQYLAAMAGQSGTLPDAPITRKEHYLAKAAGQAVETPEPITREEMYLDAIARGGGGGEAVLVTKTITENGTYAASSDNADGYSSVTVNVPPSGYVASDWLDPSKPVGEVSSDIASVTAPMIQGRTGVTALTIPNVSALPDKFALGCTGLLRVTAPQVTSVGTEAFKKAGASGAASVYMPLATLSTSAFDSAKFPVVVFSKVATSASRACASGSITTADVTGEGATLGYQTFREAGSFKVLILRSSTLIVLNNLDVFKNSPFASGGTGGTLYVPQALISSYQAATNWSTVLGYANNQIKAIEGSIYENAYADGVPIS